MIDASLYHEFNLFIFKKIHKNDSGNLSSIGIRRRKINVRINWGIGRPKNVV